MDGAKKVAPMLVVVSNRIGAAYRPTDRGFELFPTSGGLSVGIEALRRKVDMLWVGWPGPVPAEHQEEVARRLEAQFSSAPVFLPEELAKGFYEGFCNGTLWPLFHSMPSSARYHASDWKSYRRANELFADRLVDLAPPDATFWIHDYQLLLLPALLRERRPTARIGFFLHIPFPAYEILRLLPWHKEVLEGLAGADLVGFHTYDYADAYLTSLRRLLGLENALGEVMAGGRSLQVDVFPMGVDFAGHAAADDDPSVRGHVEEMRAAMGARKLTMSLCRLDYTKGVPQLLDALELFLEQHPEWRGRFQHLLVVVPSRERVAGYDDLKREIDERVGRLNGRFGKVDWTPVRYLYRYVPFAELQALYLTADTAIITPVRDGMNLVAKEFLATRRDMQGVLILSELAGAARELTEALVVNPNSAQAMADALLAALEMPAEERRRRSEPMRARLAQRDLAAWSARFLEKLEDAGRRSDEMAARRLTPEVRVELMSRFLRARRAVLLLDYDGTLVPFTVDPARASPDPALLKTLDLLARRPGVEVAVVSGRDRLSLDTWLGNLPLTLVAEHGAWMRPSGAHEWQAVVRADTSWKRQVRDVMALFTERIPGSLVEEKEMSLVWHWRGADRHVGSEAARELVGALTGLTANTEVVVLAGNHIVEAKCAAAAKGPFYVSRVAPREPDFVLAVGDDTTDENLFRVLPTSAYSVRVGFAVSAARFNVDGIDDVRRLLSDLAKAPVAPPARAAA